MAKLSARGRTEYLRARRGNEFVAYMSDGTILRGGYSTGRLRWCVGGRWDRVHTAIPALRSHVVAHGWEILSGDGPRADIKTARTPDGCLVSFVEEEPCR